MVFSSFFYFIKTYPIWWIATHKIDAIINFCHLTKFFFLKSNVIGKHGKQCIYVLNYTYYVKWIQNEMKYEIHMIDSNRFEFIVRAFHTMACELDGIFEKIFVIKWNWQICLLCRKLLSDVMIEHSTAQHSTVSIIVWAVVEHFEWNMYHLANTHAHRQTTFANRLQMNGNQKKKINQIIMINTPIHTSANMVRLNLNWKISINTEWTLSCVFSHQWVTSTLKSYCRCCTKK